MKLRRFLCTILLLTFHFAGSARAADALQVRVTCIAEYALVEYPALNIRYLSWESERLQGGENPAPVSLDTNRGVLLPSGTEAQVTIATIHSVTTWWRDLVGAGRYAVPHALAAKTIRQSGDEPVWFKLPEACRHVQPEGLLRVRTLEPERFQEWLTQKRGGEFTVSDQTVSALSEQGQRIYQRRCAACHGHEGEGADLFPRLRKNAVTMGPIAPYLQRILFGRPGSPMKAFEGVLNATELAALMTYQRNAWGHDSGDVIQPAVVEAVLRGLVKPQ